jgi:hypothetical protein
MCLLHPAAAATWNIACCCDDHHALCCCCVLISSLPAAAAAAVAATWINSPVAVKIITHSSADDSRISQELALSLSFDHPNLVRALHFTKLRINPGSGHTSLVSGLHQ